MLSFVKGIVEEAGDGYIVLDNCGIGFCVNVSRFCQDKVAVGEEVKLLTYLHVREDELTLYGFNDKFEREVFGKLILVNGVGPKMALNILSYISAQDLSYAIMMQNADLLKGIKGVGAKIRDRILLELKEKMDSNINLSNENTVGSVVLSGENFTAALKILVDWGVPKGAAGEVLNKIYKEEDELEVTIAKAFKELGR